MKYAGELLVVAVLGSMCFAQHAGSMSGGSHASTGGSSMAHASMSAPASRPSGSGTAKPNGGQKKNDGLGSKTPTNVTKKKPTKGTVGPVLYGWQYAQNSWICQPSPWVREMMYELEEQGRQFYVTRDAHGCPMMVRELDANWQLGYDQLMF